MLTCQVAGRGRLHSGSIMFAFECSACREVNDGGGKACGFCESIDALRLMSFVAPLIRSWVERIKATLRA
jgi:hypothetical protein